MSGVGQSGNDPDPMAGAIRIQGHSVIFPDGRKPFPAQLAVISKVLQALKEKKNALLESPTGTGKTLALLSSSLAYQLAIKQQYFDAKYSAPPSSGVSSSVGTTTGSNKLRSPTKLEYEARPANPINNPIPIKNVPASSGVKSEPAVLNVKQDGELSSSSGNTDPTAGLAAAVARVNRVPKIYYCTRTHSQLRQIAQELKNAHKIYRDNVNFILLGSRTHLCINGEVLGEAKRASTSVDELCKERLQNMAIQHLGEHGPCCHYMHKKRVAHTSEKIASMQVWDIEDAKTIGRAHHGCPYFAVRELNEKADYYLAPYNYLISSSIRKAMRIDLQDAIVIFDEAHNIEDVAREAASIEVPFNTIATAIAELTRLMKNTQNNNCQKLVEFVMMFLLFSNEMIQDKLDQAQAGINGNGEGSVYANTYETPYQSKNQFTATGKSAGKKGFGVDLIEKDGDLLWVGSEYLDIMKFRYDLTKETLEVYEQNLEALLGDEEDLEEAAAQKIFQQQQQEEEGNDSEENDGNGDKDKKKKFKLSAGTIAFLRQMVVVLGYMLCDGRKFADDFQVLLTVATPEDSNNNYNNRSGKKARTNSNTVTVDTNDEYEKMAAKNSTFCIWCMQGGVVFQEITQRTHSVLLASGTLSPLDSFAGELSTPFPVRVEANHVINLSNQLVVGMVSQFRNLSFNSTYQAQQSDQYLDLLGETLYIAMKLTPGGVLMFLPSYALLNRLMERWSKIPMRPGGSSSSSKDIQPRSLLQRIREDLAAKVFFEPKDTKSMNSMLHEYYHELKFPNSKAGMIAVCRGKVSEGINFSDHYARCVMVVGIPYPSLADKKVHLKRKYQDKKCLQVRINDAANVPNPFMYEDGSSWYRQQAFRAINQAVGRCIRHRNDFGAIVLLDPRFDPNDRFVVNSLSRWMRSEAKVYDRFEDFVIPLQSFFTQHDSYGHIPEMGMDIEPLPVDDEALQGNTNQKKKKNSRKSESQEASLKVKEETTKTAALNVKNETVDSNEQSLDPAQKRRSTTNIVEAFQKVKENNRLRFAEAMDLKGTELEANGDLETAQNDEDSIDYGSIGFFIDRGGSNEKDSVDHLKSEDQLLFGEGMWFSPGVPSAVNKDSDAGNQTSRGFSPVSLIDAESLQSHEQAIAPMDIEEDANLPPEPADIPGPFTSNTSMQSEISPWDCTPWDSALTRSIMRLFDEKDIRLQPKLLGGGKKVFLTQVPGVFQNLQTAFERGVSLKLITRSDDGRAVYRLDLLPCDEMRSPGLLNSGSVAANMSDLPLTTELLDYGLVIVEQWDAVDGVVFRYMCAHSPMPNKFAIVAAKVIAVGSEEHLCLLNHTFGNKALVPFMSKLP